MAVFLQENHTWAVRTSTVESIDIDSFEPWENADADTCKAVVYAKEWLSNDDYDNANTAYFLYQVLKIAQIRNINPVDYDDEWREFAYGTFSAEVRGSSPVKKQNYNNVVQLFPVD